MATKLGAAIAGAPAAKPSVASRIMSALATRRPMRAIVVPGLELDAALVLVGTQRIIDIEGDVVRAMDRRGLNQDVLTQSEYMLERACRCLAEAVREPADPMPAELSPPLGTVEDWTALPPAIVIETWRMYGDFAEEHDPSRVDLTADDIAEIKSAIEKKSAPLLRSFGVRKLAGYLLTTADPPASSPTPKSEPGDSLPES